MESREKRTGLLAGLLIAATLAAGSVRVVADGDEEEYLRIVGEVRKELNLPFSDPDDPGLLARRARLRELFKAVPASYAKEFYDRLGVTRTEDELSRTFHYRLATATRMEMLGILAKKAETAEPTTPAAVVWPTEPLPPSETPQFDTALRGLEGLVAGTTDARKWRYDCWIGKLKRPDVDDRVVEWARICPSTSGAIGAAFVVGPCDLRIGMRPSQQEIENAIDSIDDVENKGSTLGIITYMKSDIVVGNTTASLALDNLRMTHDDVQAAVRKLDQWANSPTGGSSAMPDAYISIKDWIGQHQSDPRSLYSCF